MAAATGNTDSSNSNTSWFAVGADGGVSCLPFGPCAVAAGIQPAGSSSQPGTTLPTSVRPVERALQLLGAPGRRESSPAPNSSSVPEHKPDPSAVWTETSGDHKESAAACSASTSSATSVGVNGCSSPVVAGAGGKCPAAPARPRPAVRLVPASELAQYGISL